MNTFALKRQALLWAVAFVFFSSCQTVYYETMEQFGVHKRDILVDRVEEARNSQEEAKEQFNSALEQFQSVMNFQGGALQERYETLDDEYNLSLSKAKEVRSRIDNVESVANALFAEWETELEEYTNAKLRNASESQLRQTRAKYTKMMASMQKATLSMDPVLAALKDQVLYLKHNLNARAIASIQQEANQVEEDVKRLIKEMEKSIDEANKFIKEMGL
ncbi:MAG: DUF2959 domain-containing protein [Candidatus Hinthialibacter antarcticus]|nr:DUF2959 domain-containing protein [Candidatus Hinthialibacter antarcticus]